MELKFILEALLFSAQKPLSPKELRDLLATAADVEDAELAVKALKKTKEDEIVAALDDLARDHEAAGRSYRLVCVAGAWQFVTQPEYAPWLRALVGVKVRPARLSQAALETLAIIAYRQPVTRAEVEQVRGVSVDGTMQTLLERGLVEQSGRSELVGRPALYSSTPAFLHYFGLRSLEELPAADELRRIVVDLAPAAATPGEGLATVPPQQLVLPPQPEGAPANQGEPAPAAEAAAPEPAPAPVEPQSPSGSEP